VSRHVRSLGLSEASRGVRLFKAEVRYTIGPAGGTAQPAGPDPEELLVYAFSAPAHMLEEALAARRGPRGAKGFFFKKKTDAPSITSMRGSDGEDKPSWSQAARELQREIADELLTHTCNAVFDEGPATAVGCGPPALKPSLQRSSSIILTGHGAGALVAYDATLSLLRLYPEALKGKVKCITFGMPVMGWDGREQRDSLLRLIAPTLNAIPMLRRDLPCPHFLHILRQEDLVPSTALCSRKLRSSVAAALAVAADRRNALGRHSSSLSPYSKALCEELVKLDSRETVLGAMQEGGLDGARHAPMPCAAPLSKPPHVAPTGDYDSDDSDCGYGASSHPPTSYGGSSHAPTEENGEGRWPDTDAGDAPSLSQSWRWPRWKKTQLVGVNEGKVDWDLVWKAVREDIFELTVPEWWALGKFWFFCDSHPFDAPCSPLSSDHKKRHNKKTMSTSPMGNPTTLSPSTRRDGTVVRVRRWVVQFPYFVHATAQGRRELFEPFPDSVGLLRDMLASGVDHLHADKPHYASSSKDEQARTAYEARRRLWPVQHHLGQYINAVHSWVGSSEWQISRRRELKSTVLLPGSNEKHKDKSGPAGGSASQGASCASPPPPSAVFSPPPSEAAGRDSSKQEPMPLIAEAPSPLVRQMRGGAEVAACQAKADFGICSSVADGVKTFLQLCVRGRNLHFVEAIHLVLQAWPPDQTEDASESESRSSLSASDAKSSGYFSRSSEAHGKEGGSVDSTSSSIHIAMRLQHEACGPSVLVATCEAPYGWIGAAVHARLLGSCMSEESVSCDLSEVTSFRALHALAASLENMPVCEVLHKALLLEELVSDGHLAASSHTGAHQDDHAAACPPQGREGGRKEGRLMAQVVQVVQVADVTGLWHGSGLPHGLPHLLIHTREGAKLLQQLIGELTNLEHKTRSQWSDFMRTISLGGLDPHSHSSLAHLPPPSSHSDAASHTSALLLPDQQSAARDFGGEEPSVDTDTAQERGVWTLGCGREGMAERLHHIDLLLNRPLSLSMDRSPRFKQIMGLTLAMTAGATIMAGTCLLAPYAAASVMPTVAAYVTPAHAVTGMFATSMVGTHMQARCTIDGSYRDKLAHLALALSIDTRNIRPRAIYLEAAIATRVLNHVRSILSLAPQHSEAELLAQPALFVSQLAQADSWRRLIDAQHYFEFLDYKDKRFILDFLWVVLSIHRVRVEVASAVSLVLVAPRSSSFLVQGLRRQLFPALDPMRARDVSEAGDTDQQDGREEEGKQNEDMWLVQTANLAPDWHGLRLHTIYVPDTALAGSQNVHHMESESKTRPATSARQPAQEAGVNTSRSTAGSWRQYSRSDAELVRGLACAEMLLLSWHQASQPASVVIIGKLLARRARSGLLPSGPYCCSSASSATPPTLLADQPAWHAPAQQRVFAFKILLCGVPVGDDDALRWLADKINRKLDMSRWRSFIAVARRRIRMEAPDVVDAALLHQVVRDAVEEQDLKAEQVPDMTDIHLLLASRALDDDWLTRPSLMLLPDDLLPLQYARPPPRPSAVSSAVRSGAASSESEEKLAPGFSLLHHVAHTKARTHKAGAGGERAELDSLDVDVVEELRGWLSDRLAAVLVPSGPHGVGGKLLSAQALPPALWALRPSLKRGLVVVLQAAVRRCLQRRLVVCQHLDVSQWQWSYSRSVRTEEDAGLPARGYWPHAAHLVSPQGDTAAASTESDVASTRAHGIDETRAKAIGSYGYTNVQRVLTMETLVYEVGRFGRCLERVLHVYLDYIARLRALDRYLDELTAAAASVAAPRSGKRHPLTVVRHLFGLQPTEQGKGDEQCVAIEPKLLLRNDGEQGCGARWLLIQLLGAVPLPGDKLAGCYHVRMGAMYVSLAQDMCRLPLYSNDSLTALIDELVATGANCSPPLASVLASLGTQGPRLDDALYASVPPALQLRVSLSMLLHACPATHPDAQYLRSAMHHIDSSFAIAPVNKSNESVTWALRRPSVLGSVGALFRQIESRFDAFTRPLGARGHNLVQAQYGLLDEAVEELATFRSRLSRHILETSGLDSSPTREMQHGCAADDGAGWQLVAPALYSVEEYRAGGNLVAVERSVNAALLTRLCPVLENLVSSVVREKDARIALGLPAFGWDHKGVVKLVEHLGIPACLAPLSPSPSKAPLPPTQGESQQGLPLFYAAASDSLREMGRSKTPEDKVFALAGAARAVLACMQQHAHSLGCSAEASSMQVSTLFRRCLAFTILRVAHEDRCSNFCRFLVPLPVFAREYSTIS
jgi:hypothetical protein